MVISILHMVNSGFSLKMVEILSSSTDKTCILYTKSYLPCSSTSSATDDGQTWTTVYADQVFIFDPNNLCSFAQNIGAQPLVSAGTVYNAALKISKGRVCILT